MTLRLFTRRKKDKNGDEKNKTINYKRKMMMEKMNLIKTQGVRHFNGHTDEKKEENSK